MFISASINNNSTYPQQKSCNNSRKNKLSNISFKQVSPDHFFINAKGYKREEAFGLFITKLVNETKNNVLNPNSTLKKSLYKMAKKYNVFKKATYVRYVDEKSGKKESLISKFKHSAFFGIKKRFYHVDICAEINENCKFQSYFDIIKEKLGNNTKPQNRTLGLNIPRLRKRFSAYQSQDKINNEKIVLTQFAYPYSKSNPKELDKTAFYIIHPPYKSGNKLLNMAQEIAEELKPYKNKKLSEKEIDEIYEKVGSIHWYLAQGMPFLRGSAALADAYTKTVFEALNIQTTPWKKDFAPDLEAFITPMKEYAKKYKTFFEYPE